MAYEIEGTIETIFDAQQITEKFRKREFVLETGEEYNGNYYANPLKMQCVNNHIDLLNNLKPGTRVRVTFGHKGSKYEKDGKVNYITNLNAFKIEPLVHAAPVTYTQQVNNFNAQQGNYNNGGLNFNPSPETIDDLPF